LNYRLGEALAQSGKGKEAATQWLKVVITYPQSEWAAQAQWQAAQALEKSGDKDAAVPTIALLRRVNLQASGHAGAGTLENTTIDKLKRRCEYS
jgi:TolA-binding protein